MNDLERMHLHAAIDTFLRENARRKEGGDPEMEPDLVFWRHHPVIDASEINLLRSLWKRPERAETAAQLLDRDLAATQDFLQALVAVGMLELRVDRYHVTPPTALYLRSVGDRSGPPD